MEIAMIKRTMILTMLLPIIALLPVTATATTADPVPVLKSEEAFEGRIYQVYAAKRITWQQADTFAKTVTIDGVVGHLATITSAAEDATIDRLRNEAQLQSPEAWVGGTQTDGAGEPGAGWMWVNNEGPISTSDFPLPSYSNWLPNEPNDRNTEKFLAVGLRGALGWNDEQALGNIGGFVVEFDAATIANPQNCQTAAGCETTLGQLVEYPAGSVPDGAEISVKTYEFTDDMMNRCGQTPLVLFANDGIPDNEVTIPPYLCGSPQFLLVRVEAPDVDLGDGTGLIVNEVLEALPSNLYDCFGPKGVNPPVDLDPQFRDRVTYQTTDPAKMLETDIGATVNPMYEGSLSEVTFECGSSRGKIKSNSWFGVGLSVNFGVGFDLATNPDGNRDAFAQLTRYKLLVLKAAVLESRPALNRTYGQKIGFYFLKKLSRIAIRQHDRQRYNAARRTIRVVEFIAENLTYDDVTDENYRGEHLMRSSNIEFMYTESVIPFN